MDQQISALRRGVDILVATPGRLLDHLQSRTVDLSRVEILVLDEADRMLDMGFIRDIRRILIALPSKRQNLFFSATFSKEIRGLADSFLQSPVEVAVAKSTETADLISQVVHPVDKDRKRAAAAAPDQRGRLAPGAGIRPHQARREPACRAARQGRHHVRTPSTATRARASARGPWPSSSSARCACWSRPTSRRAGSTSSNCRMSSTTNCPMCRRTIFIVSAAPAVPAVPGRPCRWYAREEGDFLRDIERMLKRSIERVVIEGFQPTGAPLRTDGDSVASRRGRAARTQQRRPQRMVRVRPRRTGSGDGRRAASGSRSRRGQGRSAGDRRAQRKQCALAGDSQPRQNSNRSISSLLGGNR